MGKFPGTLGWTSDKQWQEEVDFVARQTDPIFEQFAAVDINELASNPAYREALEVGSRLFANNCAVCHGSDARGAKGFPNLADNAWLYGNSADAVVASIVNGRNGMMPPMGAAVGGTDESIRDMAVYVMSLGKPELKNDPAKAQAVERAAPRFAVCAACHGADGTGNTMLGAPNLTDDAWLYGASLADIEQSIRNGRQGVMPAHKDLLSEEKIHVLAAYVISLSQGSAAQQQ
jgi:cytochrome c oxidase cbb3-type subunit 3